MTPTMNVWLLWTTLYFAMWNDGIEGQSVVNSDQPSDEMQQVAGLLDTVMQLVNKQQQQTRQLVQEQTRAVELKMNARLTEAINHLNQTVGRLHGADDQQRQQFNRTLSQQQEGLSNLNQTLVQLNGEVHQRSRYVASSFLEHLKLGLLCFSIPRPIVENATQSVRQTSNETIITYTCHVGYTFSDRLTTRSATCDGSSWTTVNENCSRPACRPTLTHVIPGDTHVYALTSFNNQLFVTRYDRPIAVYDTTTFQSIRNITFTGMESNLYGLAHCATGDCLYVSDCYNHKVHKLNLTSIPATNTPLTTTIWSLGSHTYPRALSVNRQHNILIALDGRKEIVEYSPNGTLLRQTSDSYNMWHAVEHVVNGTFVVSRNGPVHGVALMSVDGRVLHSYGSTTRGSGPGQMNYPTSLAVDSDGYVLVAEVNNQRILVLNPILSEARHLPLPTDATGQPLKSPYGLWLDEARGRLYVGERHSPYRVLIYDNVFNIATVFAQ